MGDDNDDYPASNISTQRNVLDFDDTLIAQPNLVGFYSFALPSADNTHW